MPVSWYHHQWGLWFQHEFWEDSNIQTIAPRLQTKLYLNFSLFSAPLSGYWFFFLIDIIWFLSSYYLSAPRSPLDKLFSPLGLHLHLLCFLVFFLLIILNSASVKYTCLTRVFLCLLSPPHLKRPSHLGMSHLAFETQIKYSSKKCSLPLSEL